MQCKEKTSLGRFQTSHWKKGPYAKAHTQQMIDAKALLKIRGPIKAVRDIMSSAKTIPKVK